MKANMLKWLELAKCDIKDPIQILDMILIDNVLSNVTDLVFTFLKEKKVKTETDLITNLNLFKDSHPGHTMDKRELHQLAATVNTTNNSNSNDRFKFSNSKTCFNCGKKGHVKSQCRQTSTSNFRYRSYTNYHNPSNYNQNNYNNHSNYSNQYRNYRSNQSASPRERRSLRNNNSYYNNYNTNRQSRRDTYNHQSNNHQNRNSNSHDNREELTAYMQYNKPKLNLYPSYVNGVKIEALRDTGSSAILIHSKLVKPDQKLPEKIKLTYANQKKFDICDTARVHLDTPWITGEVDVIILDTPAQDLIIGNVNGVNDLSKEEIMEWAAKKGKICKLSVAQDTSPTRNSLNNTDNIIRVKNLSGYTKWQTIMGEFSNVAHVKWVDIRTQDRSHKIAFVHLNTVEDCYRIIKAFNNKLFRGRYINVKYENV
ncbi:hybrid signal transduction histidine kinase D-like [Biomphalaria glabrata]|uniref:Hybrid signal transduction histidine kinase D-like n=1 Tax=Biomphalaria glabrata TaxID=6526 RepID=A0A9W3ALM4_BIOGL|nr:hybrid signal transduction histidine kinase D-like [Biomphalaria glabrata]